MNRIVGPDGQSYKAENWESSIVNAKQGSTLVAVMVWQKVPPGVIMAPTRYYLASLSASGDDTGPVHDTDIYSEWFSLENAKEVVRRVNGGALAEMLYSGEYRLKENALDVG